MKEGTMGFLLSNSSRSDLSILILRVSVGVLMLFHGIAKLVGGISFLQGMFSGVGLPGFFAYGVYLGEIVAPLMLIVGFKVKIASLLIIITMLGAIGLAHADEIFALTKHGAWAIELPMFFLLTSVAIFFHGAGRYSLDGKI